MKTCFKCGIKKPLSEFYKHSAMADGHLNKCKECAKKDAQKNYRANIKHYKEYEKSRAMLPHRIAARKAYSKTDAFAISRKVSMQKYRNKFPDKYKATTAVNNAVASGKLKKESCMICGMTKAEAHHTDYSKHLDVLWLCRKCHCGVHKFLIGEGNGNRTDRNFL
jgi:hypothetical protein